MHVHALTEQNNKMQCTTESHLKENQAVDKTT